MSTRKLWMALAGSLGAFALAAGHVRPADADEGGGCFYGGFDGNVCRVVLICGLWGCGTQTFIDTPTCRPGGSGPTC